MGRKKLSRSCDVSCLPVRKRVVAPLDSSYLEQLRSASVAVEVKRLSTRPDIIPVVSRNERRFSTMNTSLKACCDTKLNGTMVPVRIPYIASLVHFFAPILHCKSATAVGPTVGNRKVDRRERIRNQKQRVDHDSDTNQLLRHHESRQATTKIMTPTRSQPNQRRWRCLCQPI